jgi:FtsP/CotA-like multicopper oxidase with cupredoxin domain
MGPPCCVDSVELFPATTEVVDVRPDVPGTWMLHCHVADHMAGGMMTRYVVRDTGEERAALK